MTKQLFAKITKREGKVPVCRRCGKVLVPGTRVVSFHRHRKVKSCRAKRYCGECMEELNIWV